MTASNGPRALLLVACSALLGAIYFGYLNAQPFPPDIVRFVPVAWLAGSIAGGLLATRALKSDSNRIAAILALLLDVPNTVFAVLFTVAALMGD